MSGTYRIALNAMAGLAVAFGASVDSVGLAQTEQPVAPENRALQLPFITIDRDRLYAESEPGKAAQAANDAASAELIAENRQLEASLEAEERELTTRRDTVSTDEFRKLAEEFDRKVEDLRTAQDNKARALSRRLDEERQAFFEAAIPVLGQLMVDMNAVAIVDRSAIILTFDQLDVTDLAIERLNAAFAKEAQVPDESAPAPDGRPAAP